MLADKEFENLFAAAGDKFFVNNYKYIFAANDVRINQLVLSEKLSGSFDKSFENRIRRKISAAQKLIDYDYGIRALKRIAKSTRMGFHAAFEAKMILQERFNITDYYETFDLDSVITQVSAIFILRPVGWGLRGDPYLWTEMGEYFSQYSLPYAEKEFIREFRNVYKNITGQSLNKKAHVFIGRYNHGGMSSGHVSPQFWKEVGLPLLMKRLEIFNQENKNKMPRIY
ncbi:MAG: hypothetical protein GXY49_13050 [Syntrophomonadaceae bacterium]|nr:hypothetical protein [Syntrophomonadaceae bacterium]